MRDRSLTETFHMLWVAEKGHPPLPEEDSEFQIARKWFAHGVLALSRDLKLADTGPDVR